MGGKPDWMSDADWALHVTRDLTVVHYLRMELVTRIDALVADGVTEEVQKVLRLLSDDVREMLGRLP